MIRNLLFAFLLVAVVNLASAQANLVFIPESIEVEGVADPGDLFIRIEAHGLLKNEGDESITFRWERVVDESPEAWDFLTCDTNQCYEPVVYSNIQEGLLNVPVTVGPGETTPLDVYARPKGVAGSASVRVEIAAANNQDEVLATGYFEFEATAISDTEDPSQASSELKVFPNPTTNYFELKGANNVDRVVIYNIIGRELRSFNAAPDKRYNVNNLPNGLYLVSLVSNEHGILKTLRLSKSSSRP